MLTSLATYDLVLRCTEGIPIGLSLESLVPYHDSKKDGCPLGLMKRLVHLRVNRMSSERINDRIIPIEACASPNRWNGISNQVSSSTHYPFSLLPLIHTTMITTQWPQVSQEQPSQAPAQLQALQEQGGMITGGTMELA